MSEIQKICPICGKPILKKGSNAQKYCSENCRRKANRNTEAIEKHTYKLDFRLQVYDHFGYKCALCGWSLDQKYDSRGRMNLSHGCDIHHIIPVSEGGTESVDNIILLCPNCHKKADYGAISREELKKQVRRFNKDNEILWEYYDKLPISKKQKVIHFAAGLLEEETPEFIADLLEEEDHGPERD